MTKFHERHEDLTQKLYDGELLLPHRYVFVLTNICNLSCHFCFQDRDHREDAMTTENWLNVVKQLPDYARVTFTGGEPLAFKDFEKVLNAVADKHQCNMITNGLLLSEKKIDLLLSKPNFKVLSISIDDIGNKNREVKDNQWQRFVKVVQYFHKRKKELNSQCILDAKTVVLDSNANDLLKIHQYCIEDLGMNTHAFQLLKGSHLQHSDNMYPLEDMLNKSTAPIYQNFPAIMKQLELVRQYNQKSVASAFVHPQICDLSSTKPLNNVGYINSASFKTNKFQNCKFPWSSVHINVDGNMFPCIAISMGNVKHLSLVDIIQSPETKAFRKELQKKLVEGCNRCGWIRPKANTAQIPSVEVL